MLAKKPWREMPVNSLSKRRARVLFFIFSFVFLGLTGRMAYIQLYMGPRLSREAVSQQSQWVSLEIPARGRILDRNLKPLTREREAWRVGVFPTAVKDKREAATILASILKMEESTVKNYLHGKASTIPLDLSREQIQQLRRRPITGVTALKVKLRERKPRVAGHIIGYLGIGNDRDDWIGQMGIERVYDEELRGNRPQAAARVFLDGRGRFITGLGYQVEYNLPDPQRKDVVLTIDRDIQETVENVMDRAGIRDGAVVVMDAGSGDILAMASRPDYGFDTSAESSSVRSFLNRCLSFYQPGSVFKVVVAAAALEEGLVKPDDVFLCLGEADDLVKCYKKEGHGLITFAQAMAYSCNPVFARIGVKLGAEKLVQYAERFGLDRDSIIGYSEPSGKNRLERISQPYNLVNASLGQWPVEATAVQVTAMMTAIANNGIYTPPRLVMEVRNSDNTVLRKIEPGTAVRAVSEDTAVMMRTLLEMVTRYGTGNQAWVEPLGSAGKTGSAQVGSAKIDAWFTGYAPAVNPRYVATVLINDGESGGKTAAPVFREVMQRILTSKGGSVP